MRSALQKSVIVVGANSDIGSEIVKRAALGRKNRVLAVSRSPIAKSVDDSDNIVRLGGIDLTKFVDLVKLTTAASNNFSSPFSVVHCAGDFWLHKPLLETPFEEIHSLIMSHYVTLCGVVQALTPIMLSCGGGRFVAFSCNSVTYNYPDMAPFTATKAAVECFVRCFANEQSKNNISAFALALPTILTHKVIEAKPEGDHQNYITPNELSDFIMSNVLSMPHETTGNVIKLIRHSPTFYHSSYYDRNPISHSSPSH